MKAKKMVAPIVITIILLLYIGSFAWFWSNFPLPPWAKAVGVILPLGLMGVSIYVLWERIKEIRSGDEDDLGQY